MTFEPPQQGVPPENVPPPGYTPPAYEPPPSGYQAPPPAYQPPPPPAYTPPPPAYTPPAQGYGAPNPGVPVSGGGAHGSASNPLGNFNISAVSPFDWAIMAVGFLTFIFSFFSYYTVSFKGAGFGGISAHESAWHGFFGWFAAFVALLSAGLIAMELVAPQIKLPFPVRLISLGGFVLALICVLLALVVFPGDVPSGLGLHTGRGFGYWIDLILIVVGVGLSVVQLKATGGSLPWEKPRGGAGPTPMSGQYPPPGQYQPGQYPPPAQPGQYPPPAQPGQYPPPGPYPPAQ